MTSPAEPPPTDPTPASQVTRPLRELAAFVFLGANALLLFVGLIRLLAPQGAYSTVTGRAGSAFFAFLGLEAVVLPVLAVLLATHVAPVVPRAKAITQVALAQYAVSAVLGGLTLLVWMVGRLAEAQLFDALTGMLTRAAWVALFGVAGYVVWSIWQRLYHVSRPKSEPGLYGTPQPSWPGQPSHPGQQGYPDQPSHPGQQGYPGQQGQPSHPGYPSQSGYPGAGWPQSEWSAGAPAGAPDADQPSGSPDGWPVAGQPPSPAGTPASPHTWPPHGQPAVPPQSAPPFGQPASADPTQTIPRQGAEPTQVVPVQGAEPTQVVSGGSADATQVVPPPDGDADRTQRIDPGERPA
ncbi:hypothetical protein [Micromonospora radicis]|uniref:Uncharacterized protein n=1 Tax=Micromonospora radicis TaxID=1894971 RepID=A0A418MPH0_9ACTN|nr:hypothetical protein [Micromonospora radicis]RIV34478.1 hypothetical protein D2L64_22930 [Micromonospora radicis]